MAITKEFIEQAKREAEEPIECASCGEYIEHGVRTGFVTLETRFCGSCWRTMTPFQRGLLQTIIRGCREIKWTIEEQASDLTSAIEGANRQ